MNCKVSIFLSFYHLNSRIKIKQNILNFIDAHQYGCFLSYSDKEELIELMNLDKNIFNVFLQDADFEKEYSKKDPKISDKMNNLSKLICSNCSIDNNDINSLREEFYYNYFDLLEIMKENEKIANFLKLSMQNEFVKAKNESTEIIHKKIKEIEKTLVLNGHPLDPRLIAKHALNLTSKNEKEIIDNKIALEKTKTDLSQTESEINLIAKWIENGDINEKSIKEFVQKYNYTHA